MAFNIFKGRNSDSPEESFWQWFQLNEALLYDFESNQDATLKMLSKALKKVHPDLTYELSPITDDGKREFVISADGFKDAFPSVESLYSKAPELNRWIIIKYRQRRSIGHILKFGGQSVDGENIKYLMLEEEDPKKVGIVLFIPGYTDQEREAFLGIGFIFLDHALGEYDVVTRVGMIEFLGIDSEHCEKAKPLSELPTQFDYYFSPLN